MTNKFPVQDMICKLLTGNIFCKYSAIDMNTEDQAWMPMAAGCFVGMDEAKNVQTLCYLDTLFCLWFQFRKPFKIMDLRL